MIVNHQNFTEFHYFRMIKPQCLDGEIDAQGAAQEMERRVKALDTAP